MGRQLAERRVQGLKLSEKGCYAGSDCILVKQRREAPSLLFVPFTAGRFAGDEGSLDSFDTGRPLGDIDMEREREAKNLFLRTSAEGGSSEDMGFVSRLWPMRPLRDEEELELPF